MQFPYAAPFKRRRSRGTPSQLGLSPWGTIAGFLIPWAGENIDSRLNPRIVGAPRSMFPNVGGPIEGEKAASDSPRG